MEQFKYAMKLCKTLKRIVPNCFYQLYESDEQCIYAWEPRLKHHAASTMADVANAFETCNNEVCICKRLVEIATKLPR